MKLAKNLERLGTESAFKILAEAKKLETEGTPFVLRDFLDRFNSKGNIPVELIRQEMMAN